MSEAATAPWTLADLTVRDLECAWERVRDNDGAPGVDGITVGEFGAHARTALPELLGQVVTEKYRALPLRQIVIEKYDSAKMRMLLVPCVRDRVVQTAIARLLSRDWEQDFLTASYAYRPGLGVESAVRQIIAFRDQGWTWVVEADIASCFDSISHHRLGRLIGEAGVAPEVVRLLRQWIETEFWDGRALHRIKRGISQGSPISPLLANFFLTPFDRELERKDCRLIRYADDLVVLCRSEPAATTSLEFTGRMLRSAGLSLNEAKTGVTNFEKGFTYLGVTFRGTSVMIPWKAKQRLGHVLFSAGRIPQRMLRRYRVEAASRTVKRQHPARRAVEARAEHQRTEIEMPFLYVTEQGAVVRKTGERFLIEREQRIILDCPSHNIENILLFGNVQITAQAVAEALDHGISVTFFTRNGRFRGALAGSRGHNVDLRLAQYSTYSDSARRLAAARLTTAWKIANGRAVLSRYEARQAEDAAGGDVQKRMLAAEYAAKDASGIAELDGIEGAAAHAYFERLMQFNRSSLPWPGRVKHPPKDPLNSLLSLGYTF